MVNLVDQALRGPLFERARGARFVGCDARRSRGWHGHVPARRAAAHRRQCRGRSGRGRRRSRDRRGGEAAVRLRAAVRSVRRRAIAPAGGNAGADEGGEKGAAARAQSLHHRHARQSLRRGGAIAADRRGRSPNRGARRTRSSAIQPITVVIGNPPYKEKAKGRGGWIEKGAGGKLHAPLDRWKAPPAWGVGAHGKHLKNLYVYFWRWATLKVFGSGRFAATGLPDTDEEGIVCFITVAGFLNGPGFEKMRDDLRRTCSDIWVIDCSPEGHQPDVPTRIFQGVQQPVCIVLAARKLGKDDKRPARVRFRALPKGKREEKFEALAALSLDAKDWTDCPASWRAPFLPQVGGKWADFAPLARVIRIMTAPASCPAGLGSSRRTRNRCDNGGRGLIAEKDSNRKKVLFHPQMRKDKSREPTHQQDGRAASRAVLTHNVSVNKDTDMPSRRSAMRSEPSIGSGSFRNAD